MGSLHPPTDAGSIVLRRGSKRLVGGRLAAALVVVALCAGCAPRQHGDGYAGGWQVSFIPDDGSSGYIGGLDGETGAYSILWTTSGVGVASDNNIVYVARDGRALAVPRDVLADRYLLPDTETVRRLVRTVTGLDPAAATSPATYEAFVSAALGKPVSVLVADLSSTPDVAKFAGEDRGGRKVELEVVFRRHRPVRIPSPVDARLTTATDELVSLLSPIQRPSG